MYIRKKKIMIFLCVMILFMAIGYAAFGSRLTINGTASIETKWEILFTKIENIEVKGTAKEKQTPTVSGTMVTFQAELTKPGDSIEYQITVENRGDFDAAVEEIKTSEQGNEAVKFKIENIKKGDKLAKKSSTTFQVTVYFDEKITAHPGQVENELTLEIRYIQDVGQNIPAEQPDVESVNLVSKILEDNTAQADTSINFSKISSDTNGKGLYYTSTNTEDNKKTYYFRGAVANNYVKLGSMYFRIIRINEDGSVRLIYQGTSATATGTSTQIGASAFNSNVGDNSFVGYMHTKPTTYKDGAGSWDGAGSYWTRLATSSTIKMSQTYSFDDKTGEYTLISPVDGKYTSTYYNYFTCMNARGETCKFMAKLTNASENGGYYELTGAEFHTGYFTTSYEQAHRNEVNSAIKTMVDNWYQSNLSSYSSLFADSGFCNDRSLYSGTGLGRVGSYYGSAGRNYYKRTPQFSCPNEERDLFTTTNSTKGNKALTYPVGLITLDEMAYAGGVFRTSNANKSYYLYTGANYWTMSPFDFDDSVSRAYEMSVGMTGYLNYVFMSSELGVRPVINLKSSVEITSGDGTSGSPYVIKTN